MSLDDCPEFLKPRLRLFLSADIVGSTALKQSPFSKSRTEERTSWFSKIQGFYFEAHRAFRKEFETLRMEDETAHIPGEPPVFWKTVGDEVLFVQLITDHREIIYTLRCWMRAVETMRQFIKKGNSRLDVKCTAWLAGFPFRNSEVAVHTGTPAESPETGDWFIEGGKVLNTIYEGKSAGDVIVDYIGPSIDIGFRLSGFSSSRRFVISVDIAYVLAIGNPGSESKDPVFAVHYDGSQVLKGVLGGLRYPIFWLDLSPAKALERFEDGLTALQPVNRDRMREYCNRFYEEHAGYVFPPFIYSSAEQQIGKRPEWYDVAHERLVQNFQVGAAEEINTGIPEPGEEAAERQAVEVKSNDDDDQALIKLIREILGPEDDKSLKP